MLIGHCSVAGGTTGVGCAGLCLQVGWLPLRGAGLQIGFVLEPGLVGRKMWMTVMAWWAARADMVIGDASFSFAK